MIRTYSELIALPTFEDRFNYVSVHGRVGESTFGGNRHLNQKFYWSKEWRQVRDAVIVRDSFNGHPCDLACPDRPIYGKVMIHHLCPLTVKDFVERTRYLLDPEYLVAMSYDTHNAMHYGGTPRTKLDYVPRTKNDTCPWR